MSGDIEIEELKKSLSQIVTHLSDYIAKKNTPLIETGPVRIKKTSEMTYHAFL